MFETYSFPSERPDSVLNSVLRAVPGKPWPLLMPDAEIHQWPELRLRKHADYQRAYAAARKQHTGAMSYFFTLRDRLPELRLHPDEVPATGPRIGLTVPKALGKAHDRNRIKRRMRTAVTLHAGVLAGIAVDVILHPRRGVLTLEWAKLEREVLQVLRAVRKQCGGVAPEQPR